VVLFQKAENAILSGFRVVPAAKQELKAPAVIVSQSQNITLIGNVFESRGGVAVWAQASQGVKVQGNTFARGQSRGVSCDRSGLELEGNAFVGDWSAAVAAERNCNLSARRNLFFENKTGIQGASNSRRIWIERNTFVRTDTGVRLGTVPASFRLGDNLFFEGNHAVLASAPLEAKRLGRNALWRAKLEARGRPIPSADLVRTEPKFIDAAAYDFRLQAGQNQFATAETEAGADLGAFSREDLAGPFTQQLVRTLGAAIGDPELPGRWAANP
jgi:hypothetical protein